MQYTKFTQSPGAAIDALTRGGVETLTYYESEVGQIRRLRWLREDGDADLADQEPLTMAQVRIGAFEIMQGVREGKRFVIGRHGRREAVIERVAT